MKNDDHKDLPSFVHAKGPPKATFLEVLMVNHLVFLVAKSFTFSWFWWLMVYTYFMVQKPTGSTPTQEASRK